ncbi:hypothetical protein GCM10029992_29620 [Glycomyces albus]
MLPSNPPTFEENIPECVSQNLDDPSVCGGAPEDVLANHEREQRVLEMAEGLGVHAVDVRSWFCTESFCPPIVGNMLTYRDNHHFNQTYSEYLAPVLATELPDLG